MLEELWALAGGSWPTTWTCGRMDPFYRIRFDDGSWFDYSGDLDRVRAEVARFSPEDVAGFDSFVAEAAVCYRWASKSWAPSLRHPRRPAARRAQPDEDARLAQHLPHGGQPCEAPEAAHGAELPDRC
jgi:phytoene dehydrogenase-like protein